LRLRAHEERDMSMGLTKGSLTAARRRLVELLRRLHFGRVEGLALRGGDPVFDPPPRLIRDLKFPAEPAPRQTESDFHLKQQVVELFVVFDRLRDGVIDLIEVKHGLPFRLQHAEALA
jgi:hypothetical protein